MQAFADVELPLLLGQDTLAMVRSMGNTPLTLLLCTLAQQNGIEVDRASHWLACYQSVVYRRLEPALQKLPRNNILRIAVEAQATGRSIDAVIPGGTPLQGTTACWTDALELLLDHKNWSAALAMLGRLGHHPAHTTTWVQLSRQLLNRQPLYITESGQAQVDIDYLALARLYERAADTARRNGSTPLHQALGQIAASALETAGELDNGINRLRDLDPQDCSSTIQLDVARCLCKRGDWLASIQSTLQLVVDHPQAGDALSPNLLDSTAHGAPDSAADSAFELEAAGQALGALARVANDNAIPVFLVSGTPLGYVREGQLLGRDKGIDVGIVGWEHQYTLCVALQESGLFSVPAQILKGPDTVYLPIQHTATGMWMDVFVYHPQGAQWVSGVDFFVGHRQKFAFSPFELQDIEFLGVATKAPAQAELNLTENYGSWRQPDSAYLSHLESPSTLDKGGWGYMVTARLAALSASIKGQPLKLKKVLTLMRRHAQLLGAMTPELVEQLAAGFLAEGSAQKEPCHA